jgi:hypothetical protein
LPANVDGSTAKLTVPGALPAAVVNDNHPAPGKTEACQGPSVTGNDPAGLPNGFPAGVLNWIPSGAIAGVAGVGCVVPAAPTFKTTCTVFAVPAQGLAAAQTTVTVDE